MLRKLIHHPYLNTRLQYLKGTPLIEGDLERTKINSAAACFIVANKHQVGPDDDAQTILLNLAIKDYAPQVPTCLQLQKARSKVCSSPIHRCTRTRTRTRIRTRTNKHTLYNTRWQPLIVRFDSDA
jgi:hypothetical protein